MEMTNHINKFRLLLNYVLEGKILLQESQVEKLLKLLEDRGENSPGKRLQNTPCFSDLIFDSLQNLSNASTSVKVFLMDIITILFKNELQFTKMQLQGFRALCLTQFSVLGDINNIPPVNLHLAYIKLATVEISHCSGLMATVKHKGWKHILYPNIHLRPKKVSEAAYNFIAKLVWRLHEHGAEEDIIEVLGFIVEPILNSGYFHVPLLDVYTDIELCNKIFPSLSALLTIMADGDNYPPVNKVMSVLKDYFIIDHKLYEIFMATKRPCLLKLLNSCLFRYCFGVLRHLLFSKEIDDFCNKMAVFHRNYIVHAIKKREAAAVIDFVIQSNILWSQFEKAHTSEFNFPLVFERNGQKFDFSLQILVNLLTPMWKHYSMSRISNYTEINDVMEYFVVKMGRSITDYIGSCSFLFTALLEESGATYRKIVTTHTLKELLRLKGHIAESQAGLIFQSLYYVLEIFIKRDREQITNLDQDDLRLLTHLLEALKMLLKAYHIPWCENVEIICVQANLLDLLAQNFLSTKHVVQILDLINICVSKFLSPNMSLLVDGTHKHCNTLTEIGNVIKLYMHHSDWEVRDSALNLLSNCTEISFIKYVPLQKVIRENNLMILAAKTGLTDTEFYPQCTALNCLSLATKIDCIWQEVLIDNPHIILQLIYILKNQDEGMVRKEVVNVLTGVYAYQKIPQNLENTIFELMLTAALDDFHWEVQLAALNFWKKAIHNQLTYRGMLDGTFPPVTFSKEKRKIIVLNNGEIQRQLTGIMHHLSSTGCLTVLLECMSEIHNVDVMKQAYSLAKEVLDILNKYRFEKITHYVKTEPDDEFPRFTRENNIMPMNLSVTSEEERNRVINSIISENQSDLIYNLYNSFNETKMEEMEIECTYRPRRNLITAEQFLESFRNNDYCLMIEDKKVCYSDAVNTLDQILDEILQIN